MQKVVLITGAARRVGAVIARTLHARGMCVAIHYRSSATEAKALSDDLNKQRPNSALLIQAELDDITKLPTLFKPIIDNWGRLDAVVNNASAFYPTPIDKVTVEQWDNLLDTNLKIPFFLAHAASPLLKETQGCIVNIVDIHGDRPLKSYPIYSISKAGLAMATKVLAKELGPQIRVNAVAPGVVMWPEDENSNKLDKSVEDKIIARTALKRVGTPQDIANAVTFLIQQADYITGQVIAVDGGRLLNY